MYAQMSIHLCVCVCVRLAPGETEISLTFIAVSLIPCPLCSACDPSSTSAGSLKVAQALMAPECVSLSEGDLACSRTCWPCAQTGALLHLRHWGTTSS